MSALSNHRNSVQAHPFFRGVDWERLYSQRPPYTPVVTHELDTRNFENFEVRCT